MKESHSRHEAERMGQGHVFRFFDDLSPESRRRLSEQFARLDFDQITRLLRQDDAFTDVGEIHSDAQPASYIPLPRTGSDRSQRAKAQATGNTTLREGKVAALVVAGGQGTRLNFDGPKGAYPIGPVSEHSLFQIFAENILAARCRHGARIPWYVMTSEDTDAATRQFFADQGFFGLPESDVYFFQQGMMPTVNTEGKLILDAPDHIFMSPDGHGGTLSALARSGALDKMQEQGIDFISYFQVDNPIVTPLDEVFIGYHVLQRSEMSCKMVAKACPEEKLGVFAVLDEKLQVIEYSDLPTDLAEACNPDGSLRFAAGSIAVHVLNVDFVLRITSDPKFALPFHRAKKKVPYLNEAGKRVEPQEPNALKFEQFIFDALPLAARTMVLEVGRSAQFSPVKNATGVDSPETARRDMIRLYARQLEEAGVEIPRDENGKPVYTIEISPLAADSPAETIALVRRLGLKGITEDTFFTSRTEPPSGHRSEILNPKR